MKRRLYALYCRTERIKRWFSERFTFLGKAFLLTTCIAFFFGLSVQRTMIYHIFTVSLSLLFFAYLLTLRFSVDLRVKRYLPQTCVAGSLLKYRISLDNRGNNRLKGLYFREAIAEYIPGWQEFSTTKEEGEDKRNLFDRKMGYYRWLWLISIGKLIKSENQLLPDVSGGQTRDIEVNLMPLRRGNIHFTGYVLGKLDPFGLCKREKINSDGENVLVLPKLYTVGQLFFAGSRKYHQGGITAAQDRGESNEFLSLREYAYGDPVKHIDWKATARTGRTIVKQYRDEYFSRYGLVLDSFTKKKYSRVFEEGVSVAASIMMSQDNVNSVLDLLFVEQECVTCSMGRGLAGQQRMLEILASVETCGDRSFAELAGLVRSHSSLLSGIVVVLIDLDGERQDLINFLVAHKVPTEAIIISDSADECAVLQRKYALDIPLRIIETDHVEEQVAQL